MGPLGFIYYLGLWTPVQDLHLHLTGREWSSLRITKFPASTDTKSPSSGTWRRHLIPEASAPAADVML